MVERQSAAIHPMLAVRRNLQVALPIALMVGRVISNPGVARLEPLFCVLAFVCDGCFLPPWVLVALVRKMITLAAEMARFTWVSTKHLAPL